MAQKGEHLPLQDSGLRAAQAPEGGRAPACVFRPTTTTRRRQRSWVVQQKSPNASDWPSSLTLGVSLLLGRAVSGQAPPPTGFPHPQSGNAQPQTWGRTHEARACGSGALSAGVGAEAPGSSGQRPPHLLGSPLLHGLRPFPLSSPQARPTEDQQMHS